ncbi:hypothetical protein LEP3755_51250 [Leptolyngbya sp. NIES-3755]|nr:hypothetical protein LEP3755_51250 [Leptolyngbya sp. NIES-3755]
MKFSCSHHYDTEFSGILRIGKTPNTSTVTRIYTGLFEAVKELLL